MEWISASSCRREVQGRTKIKTAELHRCILPRWHTNAGRCPPAQLGGLLHSRNTRHPPRQRDRQLAEDWGAGGLAPTPSSAELIQHPRLLESYLWMPQWRNRSLLTRLGSKMSGPGSYWSKTKSSYRDEHWGNYCWPGSHPNLYRLHPKISAYVEKILVAPLPQACPRVSGLPTDRLFFSNPRRRPCPWPITEIKTVELLHFFQPFRKKRITWKSYPLTF